MTDLSAVPTITLLEHILRRGPLTLHEVAQQLGFPDGESLARWAVDAR